MLDDLLRMGSCFDWISPLIAITEDIANGPSRTFQIPRDCGWTGREVEGLLKKHGIKTWGLTIDGDTFMLSVCLTQAEFAQYLLERAGLLAAGKASGKSKARPFSSPSESKRKRKSESTENVLTAVGNLRIF